MWGASSVRSHWLDQMNIESERQVPETARALSDTNFLVSRRQTHNNISARTSHVVQISGRRKKSNSQTDRIGEETNT
jgi:hypothetical protein